MAEKRKLTNSTNPSIIASKTTVGPSNSTKEAKAVFKSIKPTAKLPRMTAIKTAGPNMTPNIAIPIFFIAFCTAGSLKKSTITVQSSSSTGKISVFSVCIISPNNDIMPLSAPAEVSGLIRLSNNSLNPAFIPLGLCNMFLIESSMNLIPSLVLVNSHRKP